MTDDKFTPEQEEYIERAYQRSLAVGLSTAPANRPRAEAVLTALYAKLNLPQPEFVWFDSPFAAVREYRRRTGKKDLPMGYYNPYWSYWYSTYQVPADLGMYEPDKADLAELALWQTLAESCGIVYAFDKTCFVCERPSVLRTDEQGNLHCEPRTGPCIAWRDGTKDYAWHGLWVPGEWIDDPAGTPVSLAFTHKNLEQRRALREIIGWDRVLRELKPRVIDVDPRPEIGTLLEVDIPDEGAQRFVRVRCGTGREFVIRTVRDAQTAAEGNAATYRIPVSLLGRVEVRT